MLNPPIPPCQGGDEAPPLKRVKQAIRAADARTREGREGLPRSTTVLGFDFGLKRIGVAVGDRMIGVAHPLQTIQGESNDQRFAAIAELIGEWQPGLLVVGQPFHPDGTEHEMTLRCRRFSRQLEGRFSLPVVLVDERFSSAAASQDLREIGITGRKQKGMLDQVAAQHILQSYLDQK